jgi:S1-C subfamily serine protease
VSPDGHLLTAKPLVDEYEKLNRARARIEEAKAQGFKVELKLWVYFDKERFDATVAWPGDKYDVAVLKIARRGPYFRLVPHHGDVRDKRIFALGYPEAASRPLTIGTTIEKSARKPGENPATDLAESDTAFSIHKGTAKEARSEAQTAYIEHSASISAISPGGPLILDDGTALGIVTSPVFDSEQPGSGPKKRNALDLSQVYGELKQHVPGMF